MPPRYAYWTILIDGRPTAFRARDQEELQPTVFQLKRKNADVVLKWFARGRLWDNPEQAQWAAKSLDRPREKRDRDWRPGGQHKDPRARFDKRKRKEVAGQSAKRDARPLPTPASARPLPKSDARPLTKPSARPLPSKPAWQGKPQTRSTNQRPWSGKPRSDGQHPWSHKPKPEGQRSWSNKGPQGERRSERPWQAKPPDKKNWPRREPPARPKRDDDKK